MFLLISEIEEITRYCCYFPGYHSAVALGRSTFILQNCGRALRSHRMLLQLLQHQEE